MSQPLIMSFRPDAAEMCLDGRKTMTRRINNGGMTTLWSVGESIAIKPGRTSKAVGRVMCTGLRVEHVRDITKEDARREGVEPMPDRLFRGPKTYRSGFETVWSRLYPSGPKSWDANPLVVVIEFRPLKEGEA